VRKILVKKKSVKTTQINAGYSAKTISYVINIPAKENLVPLSIIIKRRLRNFIDEITLPFTELNSR